MTYVSPSVLQAARIVDRPVAAITPDDWTELWKLTTLYCDDIDVPRELPHLPTLAKVIEHQHKYPNRQSELEAAIYFDARRVLKVSPEERDGQLSDLMTRRADSLSHDDLIRMAALIKVGTPTGIPDYPFPGRSLDNELRMVLEGLNEQRLLQPYFDRRLIEKMPESERDVALESLMQRHSSDLNDDEWHALASLLDMYGDAERKWKLAGIQPLLDKALLIPYREAPAGGYDPDVQRYFDVWKRSTGSQFWTELDAARDRVIAGGTAQEDVDFLVTAWSRLAMKISDAPPEDARQMANAVLRIPAAEGLNTWQMHKDALTALRSSLTSTTSPAAEQIRLQTLQLIDDTLGEARDMPEFANFGQIRSNVAFMDELERMGGTDSPAKPMLW